nr:glycosyltransferase family 4 protein [Wenzhouxiangella sp. XN79A]
MVPGDPTRRTGGSLYDARIAEGLRAAGWTVGVHGLDGDFPVADDTARRAFDAALAGLPDGATAVVDGLALGGLPEVAEAHAGRLDLVALVHHPLCDETGLAAARAERLRASETRAVAACRRIVTTSRFTARRLQALGMATASIAVVEPGTDPAPPARSAVAGSDGGERFELLSVGSLVPRKAQDLLVDALARVADRPWACRLVGAPRDPAFAERVGARIREHGLADRIDLPGEAEPRVLDAAYHAADLFVLPSHYEGFGMVVTEALARGLPLVATTGGALADTVPETAALKVAPADPDALAAALARWFDERALRARLRAGAMQARAGLPDWPSAAQRFADAVQLR